MQLQLPPRFTGIIQAQFVDTSPITTLQDEVIAIHTNHQKLPKLHITLLHQSFPKKAAGTNDVRGDKALKKLFKLGTDGVLKAINKVYDPTGQTTYAVPSVEIIGVRLGIDMGLGRESTYAIVSNADKLREFRDLILQAAGIDASTIPYTEEEDNRIFHVSLTNLTGKGGDSIAYPHSGDQEVNA